MRVEDACSEVLGVKVWDHADPSKVEDAPPEVMGVKVWGHFDSNKLEMPTENWESSETDISGGDESSGTEGRGTGTGAGGGEGARTRSAGLIFGAAFRGGRPRFMRPTLMHDTFNTRQQVPECLRVSI
jgi:hypothetical protein